MLASALLARLRSGPIVGVFYALLTTRTFPTVALARRDRRRAS